MNCERFEDVVADLARDQMMEADVRREALNHLDDCFNCSHRLRDEQALTRGFNLLSAQTAMMSARSEVEMRLREAMAHNVIADLSVKPVRSGRAYWLAVAAAILVIVGAIVAMNFQWQSRGHKEVAEQPPVVPERQKSDDPDKRETIVVNDETPKLTKPTRRRSRSTVARQTRQRTEVVSNHAQEIATEFIPLGNINSGNLQDGGYIVRMELPRSALVKFGLPVNMDRLNENVKADVWVGIDGMAHAIRFVQ